MNRITLTLLLSTACALAACSNKTQTADNNTLTADEANSMLATNNSMMMNGTAATTTLSQADQDFVTSSIKGDTAEIAIGRLAASKGSVQGVKDLGNMLVTDHGAHKQQLIDLANSAGIPVPTEPSDSGRAQLEQLQKLSGTDFDKTLLDMLIANHKKGIAKNEAEAAGTGPAAQLAQATLPVLKKHLAAAEKLQ